MIPILTLALVACASANIIFNHVPLRCNATSPHEYNGCLRGQECGETGEYVFRWVVYTYSDVLEDATQARRSRILCHSDQQSKTSNVDKDQYIRPMVPADQRMAIPSAIQIALSTRVDAARWVILNSMFKSQADFL